MKEYTLTELTHGLDVTIKGDANTRISGICTIHQAMPGCVTFLTNPLYKKYLATTQAAAVIVSPEEAEHCPVTAVITRNPYYIYAMMAGYFDDKPTWLSGVHSTAVVAEDCHIHPSASIGPHAVIRRGVKISADVVIGAGCVVGEFSEIDEASELHANVTLYHRVTIGKRVIISSGSVIGSDGFGIAKNKGRWHKVPQLGRVIIGNDVEIGANCSIDRGAIDDTHIADGVKLDNLIQVGHNVQIGENTAIAGCVGIAGSAVIGKDCLIGGGSGVNGHISIADNSVVTGMTAVTKSIKEAGIYSSGVGGLVTNLEWRKNSARLHRLDQLIQKVKELESALEILIAERKAT